MKKGSAGQSTTLRFPAIENIVPIFREVTNEQSYSNDTLARIDYEMPEKDRLATQLQSKGFGGMRGSRHNLTDMETLASAEEANPFPNGAEKKPHP